MKVGDKVLRQPVSFWERDDNHSPKHFLPGRVVYIHPKGRFHIVEFETDGGKIREAFKGV